MEKELYIKCMLFSISDDFSIDGKHSYKKCVSNSSKEFMATIIVQKSLTGVSEVLTGEIFDFSNIKIFDFYSKILKRFIVRKRIHRSSNPIHVSLYSEDLISFHSSSCNYCFVDEDDIAEYRNHVIAKYGSIGQYKKYLLHLKERANNIYNNAINEFEHSKSFKKIIK